MNKRSKPFVVVIYLVLIIVFTITQGYWALWEYNGAPSSSCLECSMLVDLLVFSFFPVIAWCILQLAFRKTVLGTSTKSILSFILLLICWIIVDTIIFDERVASWSTYSNVWLSGIFLAFWPTLTFAALFGLIYYYLNPKPRS